MVSRFYQCMSQLYNQHSLDRLVNTVSYDRNYLYQTRSKLPSTLWHFKTLPNQTIPDDILSYFLYIVDSLDYFWTLAVHRTRSVIGVNFEAFWAQKKTEPKIETV